MFVQFSLPSLAECGCFVYFWCCCFVVVGANSAVNVVLVVAGVIIVVVAVVSHIKDISILEFCIIFCYLYVKRGLFQVFGPRYAMLFLYFVVLGF